MKKPRIWRHSPAGLQPPRLGLIFIVLPVKAPATNNTLKYTPNPAYVLLPPTSSPYASHSLEIYIYIHISLLYFKSFFRCDTSLRQSPNFRLLITHQVCPAAAWQSEYAGPENHKSIRWKSTGNPLDFHRSSSVFWPMSVELREAKILPNNKNCLQNVF